MNTSDASTEKRVACPSCGRNGKTVGLQTLEALLKPEARQQLAAVDTDNEANGPGATSANSGKQQKSGWRFCASKQCDVVYFAESGPTTFTTSQLRVPVGIKQQQGERPLCYCFGHSIASIQDELRTKGRSTALEDIRAKMKSIGCHCEVSNPSGACCLGSVAEGIQIAQRELGLAVVDNQTTSSPTNVASRGEAIAKVGTLASAVLASSCCWLPLLLVAVGVSGAGIAATLEAYRPFFMGVTFLFLAMAYYFAFRPRRAAHACCEEAAGEEPACCTATSGRRLNARMLNRLMLVGVTVMAIAFLFFPQFLGQMLSSRGNIDAATLTERTVFEIDGMTCEGCAAGVAGLLQQVPEVVAVQVDFEQRRAVVATDPAAPVPVEQIVATLEKAGYRGRVVAHQP